LNGRGAACLTIGRDMHWVIDGMNVIGSRPDGWWRDRSGAIRRLAERLAAFASVAGDTVVAVVDGESFSLDVDIEVLFAGRGANAADDAIVRLVADDANPSAITVVTSDRALVRRVESLGASAVPAGVFLRRLDEGV
jgi:predicted RNA-binding protein with PIN domain